MKLDLLTILLFLVALLVLADFIVSLQASAAFQRFESSPLAIYCPRCGAERGERCRGMRTEFHVGREKLLRDVEQGKYR